MKISRRDIVTRGIPGLAASMLFGSTGSDAAALPPVVASEIPWPQRRKKIERAWLDLLGDFPPEIPPLQPVMKQTFPIRGIPRFHVSFQSEPGDRVTGWLLVPEGAKAKPSPAIICINSTTFGTGKDYTIGLVGKNPGEPANGPELGHAYGLYLAQYGYITLSIDLLTDGERVKAGERVMDTRGFYRLHPEWSMVGKNIWDIRRSVDFLQALDFVDGKHIGCTGLSLGGHMSAFAAAFEPRLAASVADGGVLDWHRRTDHWARSDDSKPDPDLERRFGHRMNHGPYIYIKKFRPYIEDPSKPIPVDFDGLMMMAAPRPLLIVSSEQEFWRHKILPKCFEAQKVYFNWRDSEGFPSIMAQRESCLGYRAMVDYYNFNYGISEDSLRQQMSELGAGDCFSWFSFPGGHSYPPVVRRLAGAWFDRWLAREPRAPWAGTST
jgi:dienelactone hydrolase